MDGRPFDPRDYQVHDGRAKEATAVLIATLYPKVDLRQGTQYGVDFICLWKNRLYAVETESKAALSVPPRFPDIHVAKRKSKIFEEGGGFPFFLNFVFNFDCDCAVLVKVSRDTPVITKFTRTNGYGNFFACSGSAVLRYYRKENGVWSVYAS